jgi:hypothetical protein
MTEFYLESPLIEPYVLPMEDRVGRLEGDMRDVKSLLSRLEPIIIRIDATLTATMPHLATRAEVAAIRSEISKDISDFRVDVNQRLSDVNQRVSDVNQRVSDVNLRLSDLPTRIYMWGVLGVLITAYGAGLAALAVLK